MTDTSTTTAEPTARDVRAWAIAQGLTTSTRGRLSAEIVEKYKAAHQ